jgi:hypothetical protein
MADGDKPNIFLGHKNVSSFIPSTSNMTNNQAQFNVCYRFILFGIKVLRDRRRSRVLFPFFLIRLRIFFQPSILVG